MHSAAWQELELPETESKCYSMFNCSHTNADLLQSLTLSNLSASSQEEMLRIIPSSHSPITTPCSQYAIFKQEVMAVSGEGIEV